MKNLAKSSIAAAIALALAPNASAGTAPFFVPLTEGELVTIPDGFKVPDEEGGLVPLQSVDERNKPWSVPAGVSQTNLISMEEVELSGIGSVVRVDAGNNSSMFDMLAFDPTGENIFIPHETPFGAGVSRYNMATDQIDILFKGDETGEEGFKADSDFGAFDPVRWTPNGTLIAGEEWAGTGRLVEICDPYATPADPTASALQQGNCESDSSAQWRVLDGLPLTSQEGIAFSIENPDTVMYFVDENNSGAIYKAVFTDAGVMNKAQTFVLSVDAYKDCVENAACDPSENFWVGDNNTSQRTGSANWVPITGPGGSTLEGIQDPTELILDDSGNIIRSGLAGRIAADNAGATPYGRPEDATISVSANGYEMIYVAVTAENSVISIEETPEGPYVRTFVDGDTATNVGFPDTNARLNSPDNLAIDSLGNIYVIEDSPNTTQVGAAGGDIWFVRDTDNDGVGESLDHFMSLQVAGSEATGMIFHPVDPTRFVVAVQHPRSTGVSDEDDFSFDSEEDSDGVRSSVGFGDAIWEFDLANVHPPQCTGPRSAFMTFNQQSRRWVRACSSQRDFNVIEQMIDAEVAGDYPTP